METEDSVRTAECTDMNEMGSGIVRIDGMVVFVPGLIPGETAEITVTEKKKNYAFGSLTRLISPSRDRIAPLCPDEEVCGGCTLGHVSFETENAVKRNTVRAALRKAGLGEVPVEPVLHGEQRYGYRNKITLHYDGSTGRFGYCKPGSEKVLPFRGCPLCPDLFSEIVLLLGARTELTAPLSPGSLTIRSGNEGVQISFSGSSGTSSVRKELEKALKEAFPAVVNVLFGGDPDGIGLTDRIAGLDMCFSAESFRQVNTPVFELLLNELCTMASEQPFSRAADLYCGTGIIGLTLAKAFPKARVTGIEINPEAVRDGKKNASANGIGNIRFFAGDASTFRKRIGEGERPDLIVTDPPRAGLSESVRRDLISLSPERILYVSCNPQTLARDLCSLADAGYQIRRVLPVNMFPVTKHVETVCLLSKLESQPHIEVKLNMSELDLTKAEKKATYQEIRDYVMEHTGLKVSSLYIAQVKEKCGIIERENYNKPKSPDAKQAKCPPEKEKAIREALRHFGMIEGEK